MVLSELASQLNIPLWTVIVVLIWVLAWKGFALWKAGRRNQPVWFVALLVVNTLGLLEILYIFLFSEIKLDDKKQRRKNAYKI
ncbi:DUF5652 family protein [Candidatus Pacearchaeota archaeon]|nr:DUF5652 family protein [Candidatus Pacearchaeota archaeon]